MVNHLQKTPAFQRWSGSTPGESQNDWQSYQAFIMRMDLLLCAADLLWPEFILKDNLILRKSRLPDEWDKFVAQAKEANWLEADMEYMINHIHISDIILNDPDREQIALDTLIYFANILSEIWGCRLKMLFPDKSFVVQINTDEDPEVSVYTVRD